MTLNPTQHNPMEIPCHVCCKWSPINHSILDGPITPFTDGASDLSTLWCYLLLVLSDGRVVMGVCYGN